jgi:protein-L-isoaspartate(D-aspartate) O-methyltransferase
MSDSNDSFSKAREKMLAEQLVARGIKDKRVIEAFREIPRHQFVLPQDASIAYEDYPLPIGNGQTISQPYIVAFMVEQLKLQPGDTVLEIGTGSGYAAAIISQLVTKVYTLEVVKELYERALKLVAQLHYRNIECRLRDGRDGLPEAAPFDKIILSAAPEELPMVLLDQLKVGGSLIAPLGSIKLFQQLQLITKRPDGQFEKKDLMGVSFIEMQ